MIRWNTVLRFLSYIVLAGALVQVPSLGLALAERDAGLVPLLCSIAIALAAGTILYCFTRATRAELSSREGILIVVATWVILSVIGALPFYFSRFFHSFTDAFFESISGFTTTGATILSDIESLPGSLQFWRCLMHWLGGMGIIVLGVAILPLIGVGGMALYRAEFSGARSEKITPRIAETASSLWRIYAFFSLLLYLALRLAGMGSLDAMCCAFSTMGTGGFSTRNSSIAAFDSIAIETILIVFMLIAGINFTLHYRLLVERRVRRFLADRELLFYLLIVAVAVLLISTTLVFQMNSGVMHAVRVALFQVASIVTTTGYATVNYEIWPSFAQLILLALMFVGGSTGSTAGGLKTARIVLLLRVVRREFRRLVERRGVFSVRLGNTVLSEPAVQGLLNLVYLAFVVNFAASLVLTALGLDILTAISAAAAAMFNIGPGLGTAGPFENYGHFPTLAKWVFSFCMLAGRLEFYTVLVIATPYFWQK